MKNYYVVTAELGGDRDICYYIFEDETYFEAFLECLDLRERDSLKEIIDLIDNYQVVDGLFDFLSSPISEDEADEIETLFKKVYVSTMELKEFSKITKDGEIVREAEVLIL